MAFESTRSGRSWPTFELWRGPDCFQCAKGVEQRHLDARQRDARLAVSGRRDEAEPAHSDGSAPEQHRDASLSAGCDAAVARRQVNASVAVEVARHQGLRLRPGDEAAPPHLVYQNFRTILKWNRSHYFATAVGTLADRIAGF